MSNRIWQRQFFSSLIKSYKYLKRFAYYSMSIFLLFVDFIDSWRFLKRIIVVFSKFNSHICSSSSNFICWISIFFSINIMNEILLLKFTASFSQSIFCSEINSCWSWLNWSCWIWLNWLVWQLVLLRDFLHQLSIRKIACLF